MFNKKVIRNLLLFSIIPIFSLIFVIYDLTKKSRSATYFTISLFFFIVFLKSPPAFDAIRYLEMYDNVVFSDLLEFSNYYNFYLISYLFKLFGIPFYFIPAFFVFFSVYFALKSLDIIVVAKLDLYKVNPIYFILFLIGLIIFINPIFTSYIMRNNLATSLFLYAVVNSSFGLKKKSYCFLLLSSFIHFSFIFISVFYILIKNINISRFLSIFLMLLGFLLSKLVLLFVFDKISFITVSNQYAGYLEYSQYGNYTKNMLISLYFSYSIKIIIILLCFLIKPIQDFDLKIHRFLLWMVVLLGFVSVSDSALDRFVNLTFIVAYIYLFSNVFLLRRKDYYCFIIFLLVFIYFIVLTVYMFRMSFINGNYLLNSILTPLQFLLYDDRQYRELLNFLHPDGTWK